MWEQTIYVHIRWVKKWIFTVVCAKLDLVFEARFWMLYLSLQSELKIFERWQAIFYKMNALLFRQTPIWVTVIKWLKYPPHINSSYSGKQFNNSPKRVLYCYTSKFICLTVFPAIAFMNVEFFSFLVSGEKQDFCYIIYQICKTFFWKRRLEEVAQRQENLFSISKRGFTPNKDVTWAWQTQKGIHCKDVWHFDGFVHFHQTILDRQRLFLCQFDNRQGTYSIKLPIWDVTHSNG